MLKTLPNTLLLLFSIALGAQEYQPLEWGEVGALDRAMLAYEPDSSAQAVVLGDEGYMNVGISDDGRFEWQLRRHRRVKILNEAALDKYGNASVYLYHKDGLDKVRQLKAQTIAPDGTVTEVNKKNFYREKINDYWTKISFSFPNAVTGSVLEYRYQHFSTRWVVPEEWVFREPIPVRSSYFKFGCKAPVVYTYLLQGTEYTPVTTLEDGRQLMTLGDMSLMIDKTAFWMQNGQAITEEPYMTTIDDYYMTVRFQGSEILRSDGTSESVYGTWEETAKELLDRSDIGQAFGKTRNHKNLIADATTAITPGANQNETVAQIAAFLHREIKWSGRRGVYSENSPDAAYKLHESGLPEIQYAGISLLRHYGMEADPVILSTRDNGEMITGFPFLDQFNYVVILAKVDERYVLLDFSDPYLGVGNIQPQALNGKGFLLKEDNPIWINLEMPVFQDLLACSGKITPEGNIEAEMKCTMRAYSARIDRQRMSTENLTDIWAERLPGGVMIDEIGASNEEAVNEPLVVDANIQLTEAGFSSEEFLYISPLVYSSFAENPFVRETRSYPIDFAYPFEEKTVYSYEVPEGYTVDALPENGNVILPNGDASFQYLAREKDGKISILVLLRIKKTYYLPSEYEALRALFDTAAQKMQDQIVLRKS